jgi:hypothetical protein
MGINKYKFTATEYRDALINNAGNQEAAALSLGMPRSTFNEKCRNLNVYYSTAEAQRQLSMTKSKDIIVIDVASDDIKTPDQAIEAACIDTAIWEVEKIKSKTWDTTMKLKIDGREKPAKVKNYGFTIQLKRKIPEMIAEGASEFIKRISDLAPTFKIKTAKKHPARHPLMAVFSIYDSHFGKLAWEPETGANYDLAIAKTVYSQAVDGLLEYTKGRDIQKIEFPIGNDMLHIDNTQNTTTAGTPQDVDGRLQKIFNTAAEATIRAIGRMTKLFPHAKIHVRYVPGNHDATTSWFLVSYLKAYFRNHPSVIVDIGPKYRKYTEYGVNSILFTHGNNEKLDRLPFIMAAEEAMMWARTKCREAHTGHKHSKGEMRWIDTEEYEGFVVRRIPSLTTPDAWHYKKGYVNNRRAAEVFLYSKTDGYFGHYSSNV